MFGEIHVSSEASPNRRRSPLSKKIVVADMLSPQANGNCADRNDWAASYTYSSV
jgi:hypothetical protein